MLRFFPNILICVILVSTAEIRAKDVCYMGLGEGRDLYHTELLTEILKSIPEKDYQVKRYSKKLPHHRSFSYLGQYMDIDIVVAYATKERDKDFLSVPIPIVKGVNGWRVAIVHNDNVDMFAEVSSLTDLRKFLPGQHHAWTDLEILKSNGIDSITSSSFDGLYLMLDKKRFEYFPRSIIEVSRELEIHSQKLPVNVTIDPHIIIRYPTAFYFYLNKTNFELAKDVRDGFERLIANGKFNAIFDKYYGEIVEGVKQQNRQILELHNPFLPSSVPIDREELWVK